jgi:hypothetical protein
VGQVFNLRADFESALDAGYKPACRIESCPTPSGVTLDGGAQQHQS